MEQTTTIIIRKLPVTIHREFKALCAMEGISQQEKFVELITNYTTIKYKEGKGAK